MESVVTPLVIQHLLIWAAYVEAGVLSVTVLVLYKNLKVIRLQNTKTFERFEFQSVIEKYNLTLKFADWIKSELQDYSGAIDGDEKLDNLTMNDIKEHLDNIAKNLIHLVLNNIIFVDLARDEIKKLSQTIAKMDEADPTIVDLNRLLEYRQS